MTWQADVGRWRREEILIPLRNGRPVYRRKAWRSPDEDGIDRRAGIIGIGLQLLKRELANPPPDMAG